MSKEVGKFIAGTIILIFLTLGINLATSLKLLYPQSVIEWIGGSSHPREALWAISVMTASALVILLKLGIKLPLKNAFGDMLNDPKLKDWIGISAWVPAFLMLAAGIALVFLQPICQSPTPVVEVSSPDEEALVKYNGQAITAHPGAELTLKSIPSDNTVIFCTWEKYGSAVDRIAPVRSCTTHVHLSNEPGRGSISLSLTKSFCSVSTKHPLAIIIVPEEGEE